MAAALLLGLATIATLAVFSNGQNVTLSPLCQPCTKILQKICAKDKHMEVITFPNPCMIDYCNCLMNASNTNNVFTKAYEGECKVNETKVPECFMEGSSTLSPGAGNQNTTGMTSGGSSASTLAVSSGSTSTPTLGGRSINTTTTTVAPGGTPGLKAMLLTLALPLAALSIFL